MDSQFHGRQSRYAIVQRLHDFSVNPRPELGNVVNIKLNETIENGIFADGTLARLKVETVFEVGLSIQGSQ